MRPRLRLLQAQPRGQTGAHARLHVPRLHHRAPGQQARSTERGRHVNGLCYRIRTPQQQMMR